MVKQGNPTSKAIKEFLSESQDFVEILSNVLMEIDGVIREEDEVDPDYINEAFRCWHTLKGLSSTFGAENLAHFAHNEETFLDEIRLGKKEMDEGALDRLLGSVDIIMDALSRIQESGDILIDINVSNGEPENKDQEPVQNSVTKNNKEKKDEPFNVNDLISRDVLEVLTEFEEHRLVTNIKKGRPLYKIRAGFSLMSIDTELEEIKSALKPTGEIITYLPCDESSDPDKLDIEVLVALKKDFSLIENVANDYNATLELLLDKTDKLNDVDVQHNEENRKEQGVEAKDHLATEQPLSIAPPVDPDNRLLSAKKDDQVASISLRSVSQTVRVDIGKLDSLMNSVGELGIIRSSLARVKDSIDPLAGNRELSIELHRILRGFERRLIDIREGILEVRMVPVGQMFDRLSRIIRKVSRNLGKEIQFIVSGQDTEVDKLIIEELSDPLMHIVRNAIDHGIENPSERELMGKPKVGTVALTAYQKGNHVIIEIEDDGSGIDGDKITESAIRSGAITAEQADLMSQDDRIGLIFLPGISTAKETTELSGRGVGMDVVKTNISSLGGIVDIASEIGIGTKFTITMPVTLAIMPALMVSVDSETYTIALNTVAEAIVLNESDINSVMNTDTMTLRGQTLPLCRLDYYFNIYRPGPISPNSKIVIASLGNRRLGLVVDSIDGQQDIIIKPLGTSMKNSGCFAGVTDIGDKKLALVIDTVAVIEEFFASRDDNKQVLQSF